VNSTSSESCVGSARQIIAGLLGTFNESFMVRSKAEVRRVVMIWSNA
jgi:hypothetical protein